MKAEWVKKKTIIKDSTTHYADLASEDDLDILASEDPDQDLSIFDYTQTSEDPDAFCISMNDLTLSFDNKHGEHDEDGPEEALVEKRDHPRLALDQDDDLNFNIHDGGMRHFDLTSSDFGPVPCDDLKDSKDILIWCATMLANSPVFKDLWRNASKDGWFLSLTGLHNQGYQLNLPRKTLYLDDFGMDADMLSRSDYFRHDILMNLMRALRDVWHESQERDLTDLYAPENILILERVRAADCDTVAILGAWELRGAGYPQVWRHVIGAPEGDMALSFTQYLERDPSALFDGSALAYAFRQWFAGNERVNACDHETLEYLDDLILSDDTDPNPFGQDRLTGKIIEQLSNLPDGVCYLKRLGDMILEDPYYAGMNDPINQAHLFQMIYDLKVTMVNNVPFADGKLARKIFPDSRRKEQWK